MFVRLKHFPTGLTCLSALIMVFTSLPATAQDPSGEDIVKHCAYKYAGDDQRTKLSIILRDKEGNERKNIYLRLWKAYNGKDQIEDKMVLFTQYPPDAQGAAFMRWSFVPAAGKNADQWIYLSELRKTRRVSIRDPGDSFLGSDLTYADISPRAVDQDKHKFLKIEKKGDAEYYVVESVPKEKKPLYSKKITWFKKTKDWSGCVTSGIIYYDPKGELLKKQSITWQKIGDAWLWKKVEVENVQTKHSSVFEVSEPEVNVGLGDELFTERSLKRGYSAP